MDSIDRRIRQSRRDGGNLTRAAALRRIRARRAARARKTNGDKRQPAITRKPLRNLNPPRRADASIGGYGDDIDALENRVNVYKYGRSVADPFSGSARVPVYGAGLTIPIQLRWSKVLTTSTTAPHLAGANIAPARLGIKAGNTTLSGAMDWANITAEDWFNVGTTFDDKLVRFVSMGVTTEFVGDSINDGGVMQLSHGIYGETDIPDQPNQGFATAAAVRVPLRQPVFKTASMLDASPHDFVEWYDTGAAPPGS